MLWKPNEHAGYRRDLVVILILCSAFVGCTGIGGGSLGYVEISPILALLFSILFYFCIIISSPHYVLFLTLIAFASCNIAVANLCVTVSAVYVSTVTHMRYEYVCAVVSIADLCVLLAAGCLSISVGDTFCVFVSPCSFQSPFLFLCLCACIFVCLSVWVPAFVSLSVCMSICLCACVPASCDYLSACVPIYQHASLCVCLCDELYVRLLCLCACLCLSVCLSMCLYV